MTVEIIHGYQRGIDGCRRHPLHGGEFTAPVTYGPVSGSGILKRALPACLRVKPS
jgi:hypothetical protein